MQITATWGEEEVAVEVGPECRTLAALEALLQDALPEVDVGTVRLEVGGRELADDDDVCGLEAGSVVEISVTAAALAAATLRKEGWEVDFKGLHRAAALGNVRACRLYLDAGVACKPGVDEKIGVNGPLHQACLDDRFGVVDLLIDRGCAIDEKNDVGDTPLHIACDCNRVEIVRLLLDRGCATDHSNLAFATPLHNACELRSLEIVTLLVARGCAPDKKNVLGDTPLHIACAHNDVEIARLLLDRGSAIEAENNMRVTPLHHACEYNRVEMAGLLVDCGAAINAAIQAVAQEAGSIEIITLLSRASTVA